MTKVRFYIKNARGRRPFIGINERFQEYKLSKPYRCNGLYLADRKHIPFDSRQRSHRRIHQYTHTYTHIYYALPLRAVAWTTAIPTHIPRAKWEKPHYTSSAGREKVLSQLHVEKSSISASRVRKSYLGFAWKKVLSQLRA